MSPLLVVPGLFTEAGPPVTPDAPTARAWLLGELAKAPYQAAKPTWFDLASQAVRDWLAALFTPKGGGLEPLLVVVLVVVIAALVVVALIVFGRPRLNRRSRLAGEVFGSGDERDAAALRRAAAAAAASGDWGTAVEERFRAIARALDERTLVWVSPGTTAHAFAEQAATVFEVEGARLRAASALFDRVRYLGGAATQADYEGVARLDDALSAARPALSAAGGGAGGRA
ncbi:DUF4129 domain-containing protein [Microbacterium sp. STN6]|uniref:DUF4129 domain-containing protein n=1 Tax=Microbacterium sp. STN6 TaxID=2995588 RepID=UPI002260E108|nr:DUF4129 domain-containing protein [Microbacterium sp. STN6]MCX7521083.1 DUF4129 domain-containing protein [Microbacterium sp. STN6]